MSRGAREPSHTQSGFHTPVVIGACLLLLCVIGVVVMVMSGEDRLSDVGSGQGPGLTLTGLPDDMLETLTVSVTWWEAGQTAPVRQDAEPVTGAPGSFRLPPQGHGRKVEIDVLKGREIILRKKVELAEGAIITIDLAKEPAYREDGR